MVYYHRFIFVFNQQSKVTHYYFKSFQSKHNSGEQQALMQLSCWLLNEAKLILFRLKLFWNKMEISEEKQEI